MNSVDPLSDLPPPAAPTPVVLTASDLYEALPDAVFAVDSDGRIRHANEFAHRLLGFSDLIGLDTGVLVHPDDQRLIVASLMTVRGKDVGALITFRLRTALGSYVTVEARGAARSIGGVELVVVVARTIGDRHGHELDGGETVLLRSVMANMHGMVALVDSSAAILSVNAAVTRILGHHYEAVRGRPFLDFVHPDDADRVFDTVTRLDPGDSTQLVVRLAMATGASHVMCEFTVINLLDDPTVGSYIVSGQLANALDDAQRRVDFLADHDSRTGLLNRDGFLRSAGDLVRNEHGLAIMIVDVVQFRSINELYGEHVGDAVLMAVADRIAAIRWPDLVSSRFGGDEFVLALRSVTGTAVEMLRDRIRRDVAQPVVVDGRQINVGIRTAAAFEARPDGLDSLLTMASTELVRLKRNADPDSAGISVDTINRRRQHLDQLRHALDSGEIQPFFQPIVDPSGQIIAIESLVRWVHPLRGVLGVNEILPLAQMAGLAEAIDDTVLHLSFDFARHLAAQGRSDLEVHVNVDPKVLSRPEFADTFLTRCTDRGADPARLVVEITETDLLAPGATALGNLNDLRRAGIHVSIDDFGTGYSSLSHLLELPVDGVKIDRKFVAGIDIDPAATNLTTAILGLSESLQLGCVAEGVEQPYQRDRLASLGCNAFQGWLYSPAVSATDLMTLLGNPGVVETGAAERTTVTR